jgi:hypothetical protein
MTQQPEDQPTARPDQADADADASDVQGHGLDDLTRPLEGINGLPRTGGELRDGSEDGDRGMGGPSSGMKGW